MADFDLVLARFDTLVRPSSYLLVEILLFPITSFADSTFE